MHTVDLRSRGVFLIDELITRLGDENSLNESAREALLKSARAAMLTGKLLSRHAETTARICNAAEATPYVTVDDFNSWLQITGAMFPSLSTLRSVARQPAVTKSQWEGRTAKDFIEELRRYGSFTAAGRAHGVTRQAYTQAYYRAVGQPALPGRKKLPQVVAPWAQGLAQGRKK